ncbi:UNVERIFIED_CONTAM: hypothetical protein Slati_3101700 [Sesamum latifolium]|uniref:Uncharacterized protein n=1 Tax=Sesamum latifolium TaxID=2727402 RepID=A0AAW2UV36_9LAMI
MRRMMKVEFDEMYRVRGNPERVGYLRDEKSRRALPKEIQSGHPFPSAHNRYADIRRRAVNQCEIPSRNMPEDSSIE